MNEEQQKVFKQKLIDETKAQIRKEFERIFELNHILRPEDIAFLKARQSYLTKAEVEEYSEELKEEVELVPTDPMLEHTRKELEEIARSVNVTDPENLKLYSSKEKLVAAIKEAQAKQE